MSRILLLCLTLSFTDVAPAQILKLSQDTAIVCRINDPAEEWLPSPNEIAALERALPIYLALHAGMKEKMPTPNIEYARQYSGIVQGGRKYIYGRYYPASGAPPFFAKAGDCWQTHDGGPAYWNLIFDPESGKIVSHTVNGIA